MAISRKYCSYIRNNYEPTRGAISIGRRGGAWQFQRRGRALGHRQVGGQPPREGSGARLGVRLLNRCLRHYGRSDRKRQWWDFGASTRSSSCAVETGNSIDPLPSKLLLAGSSSPAPSIGKIPSQSPRRMGSSELQNPVRRTGDGQSRVPQEKAQLRDPQV